MTTALDAITRIDDGFPQPGDALIADIFDRHCQQDAFVWPTPTVPCVVCGQPSYDGECTTCCADWDRAIDRRCDQ